MLAAAVAAVLTLGETGVAQTSTTPAAVPEGLIPNRAYPQDELYEQIGPQLGAHHHNQPTVVNGYLLLAGNGAHQFWDISNPYSPQLLSELLSPHRAGQAESHQVSYSRHADGRLHLVTISGRGIDLWDVDDVRQPRLLSALELPNISYGDVHNAVWGVAWDGEYIYVGATSNGLYIVDAADPQEPRLVAGIPTTEIGGVPPGKLWAIGNLLVVTTPKEHAGIATLDISEPAYPTLLDYERPRGASYIEGLYGRNVYLQRPVRIYDVATDPRNIAPVSWFETPASQYMSFGDGHLFLGGERGGSEGIWQYDIADPTSPRLVGRLKGRDPWWDDQFSVPMGNLLAISDDQNVEGYVGSFLAVNATEPDKQPLEVMYVNPPDGAASQALTTRIGLSFSDWIELATVDSSTLSVRPLGGEALIGKWGLTETVLTFWPEELLQPETDYEIVAVANGIKDLVGNALAQDVRTVFRTGSWAPRGIGGIERPHAVVTGQDAVLTAKPVPGNQGYRWDFGDGTQGAGGSVSHSYDKPGRYTVTLSVVHREWELLEAEEAELSGGAVVSARHRGHFGSGYVEYPQATGPNVKVRWHVARETGGQADVAVRYANGGEARRQLVLLVNGQEAATVALERTGGWRRWRLATVRGVRLGPGDNTVELVALNDVGPLVDGLSVTSETRTVAASYSATQVVHRPLSPTGATRSSPVIVTVDQTRVWAVNQDASTVTAVDAGTLEKVLESTVGTRPRTLAEAPDGTIWVVNEESHDISVVDSGTGAVVDTIGLPYASMPYGITFAPDGGAAYVTLQALGRLVRVDPATRAVVDGVELGPDRNGIVPRPRGIAIDGESDRVLVTRFLSPPAGAGAVYDVRIEDRGPRLAGSVVLAEDPGPDTRDGGRGVPNYISALAISPDGYNAWVPSKKDNVRRGVHRDGQALTHESTVRTILSSIDLATGEEDVPTRVDLDDHGMASAVAFSPLGDLVFVAVQGSNAVVALDAYDGSQVAGMAVGSAPQGLALDARGRLYVHNYMGRSLSVFDVGPLLTGTGSPEMLAEVDLVADEPLSAQVLAGKRIFYDASSSRMSLEGYMSCASCHLDGGQDGRTWDFTGRGEGLRNTITLRGRGGSSLHGPLHWTGNFDEVQDVEADIRVHLGGTGFLDDDDFNTGTRNEPLGDRKEGLSPELDALAAYVASLTRIPPSPYRNADGSLTTQGELGRAVFASHGCADCHAGPQFTDSALGVLHDVGTTGAGSGMRLGRPLVGLDTPTLKGVWATAPYLHDGSAMTLSEAIVAHDGVTLDEPALEALVAYVLQIDEFADPHGDFSGWAVEAADSVIEEGDATTVTVSAADGVTFSEDRSFRLATGGTASSGDFVLSAEELRLPAGGTAVSATLTAVDDDLREDDETLTLTASLEGVTVGQAEVTITKNDQPPAASVWSATSTVVEGAAVVFMVSLDRASARSVPVRVEVAQTGSGLSRTSVATVTVASGATSAQLVVETEDDVVAPDRSVVATVVPGPDYTVGAALSAEVAVTDNDRPAFDIVVDPSRVAEGATSALKLSITNGVTFAEPQEIGLSVSGMASASDYTLVPVRQELAPGASSATAVFGALDDDLEEGEETARVAASVGGVEVASADVLLVDPEPPRIVGFPQSGNVLEAAWDGPAPEGHQWLRGGVAVPGATGKEYLLTVVDVGERIAVRVLSRDRWRESANSVRVWRAPGNPPLAAGEEELLAAAMTVATRVEGFWVTGYSRLPGREFGWLDTPSFAHGENKLTLFVVNSRGDLGLSTAAEVDASDVTAYWDSHAVAGLERRELDGRALWIAPTTQPATEYERHILEDTDGLRVAVSLRRPLPAATVAAVVESVAEGGAAAFEVSLDRPAWFDVEVRLSVAASGGATLSGPAPESARIAAGDESATVEVATADDAVATDGGGAVTLTLAAGAGYLLGGTTSATIEVEEDDAASWRLAASPAEIDEGGAAEVAVSLAHGVVLPADLPIALGVSGTASADDYELAPSLLLRAGTSSASTALRALADWHAEPAETVTVAASAGGETLGAATVSIRANAAPPPAVATLEALSARVPEGEPAAFLVSLDAPAPGPLAVAVAVSETGAALAGEAPGAVLFAAGERAATLSLPTEQDAVVEADSAVTAALAAGDGYAPGTPSSATATVADDDEAEMRLAAAPAEIDEGGSAELVLSVANGVVFAADAAFALAASGTASADDYDLPGSVTLAAGATSARALLTAVDDAVPEPAETVTATASRDGAAAASVTVTIRASDEPSDDARLASLVLSDVDVGAFSPERTAYAGSVAWETSATTVEALPAHGAATVEIADGSGSTLGPRRTVALAEGVNGIAATVTAEDGATVRVYRVSVTRAHAHAWGERLPERDVDLGAGARPTGLWSDGETLWAVRDWRTGSVAAYALADGAALPDRGFALRDARFAADLWSDGTTLWASDYHGGVTAHRLSDGARLPESDLDAGRMAASGNAVPTGLWSDGTTLWVADLSAGKAFAYRPPDGSRAADREFAMAVDDYGTPLGAWGLWSDGATVLAADYYEDAVRGYRLSDGSRLPDLGLELAAERPMGLWSDGRTLWVVHERETRVHAYAVPGLVRRATSSGPFPVRVRSFAARVPSASPGRPAWLPDDALRGRVLAALGKAPGAAVGERELLALTGLDARGAGVVDLTGIGGAANLAALDLGGNPLAGLAALAGLGSLRTLNLDGVAADLAPLGALPGLRRLSLRGSDIADVSALAALAGLRVLDVGDNRIADIGPLVGLVRLQALRADGNRIADASPLDARPRLRVVDLRGNPATRR